MENEKMERLEKKHSEILQRENKMDLHDAQLKAECAEEKIVILKDILKTIFSSSKPIRQSINDWEFLEWIKKSALSLGFSVRCSNIFNAEGIHSIKDLLTIDAGWFATSKNVGRTTILEIKSKLSDYNLKFKKNIYLGMYSEKIEKGDWE